MKLVLSLNANGTASITTPIAQPGESDAAALARVLASIPGSEPLSPELVRALRLADAPPPGAIITRAAFRLRLAMVYLALGNMPTQMQNKWDRVLSIINDFESVHLTDPTVQMLVQSAVTDKLLTSEQAATVMAVS